MSFCDSARDYDIIIGAHVCRQCGMVVTGHDMRQKGQRRAVEDAARGCAMQSAITKTHEQIQRRIGALWGPSA